MIMKNVKFLPWVGKQYEEGISGHRIMVLGESHHCASAADAVPEITRSIIQDYLDPNSEHEGYKNTYTKFERALAGKVLTCDEEWSLWGHILFYNYVQSPISKARKAPTLQEFCSSEAALFEVLETYRPDRVIVCGKRLYNNLPQCGRQLADLQLPGGDGVETWGYTLSSGKLIQLLPIYHPSAGFSWMYWHEVMQAFINR